MKLFEPVKIGNMELKNRIVMPPMSINLADEGYVTEKMIRFYEERAKGGVGFIVVEDGIIDVPIGNNVKHAVGIDSDSYIPKLTELAARLKKHGTKATVQLSHGGRRAGRVAKSSGYLDVTRGKIPVAPSSIAHPVPGYVVPRELTVEEIEEIVEKFGEAAARVREAGFDAVGLHCAHMYLCGEFLSPWSNIREDAYGGSLQKRMRFVLEIIESIQKKAGCDLPLIVRMNGQEPDGGNTSLEIREIATALEKAGADAIHVSTGFAASIKSANFIPSVTPMNFPQGCIVSQAENIKEGVSIPVIAVNMIRDIDYAESILQEGRADLIAFGRPLIADPMLPLKAKEGRIKDIVPCISCCQGCISNVVEKDLPVRCTVNPAAGQEAEYPEAEQKDAKKVVVVGAGPAGLSAAVKAAELGHDVVLFERDNITGGRLNTAKIPPGKDQIGRIMKYYRDCLEKYPIKVVLGVEANWELINKEKPEAVILAAGSTPLKLNLPGIDGTQVVMATDVLDGKAEVKSEAVIIGGGQVGLETADFLSEKGYKVTVVEMKSQVGEDMPAICRNHIMADLEGRGVRIFNATEVAAIKEDGIDVTKKKGPDFIPAGTVIIAAGFVSRAELAGQPPADVPVFKIGDYNSARKMYEAIHEGIDTALKI